MTTEPVATANDDEQLPPTRSQQPWSRRIQRIAAVGWSGFLAACVGTLFFFAFIDPLTLGDITQPPMQVSRMTGYAIGFFFFWVICTIAGTLTSYLLRRNRPPGS